ncbi:MAG TPA: hypothetical protein PLD47_11180, partial [Aggregatilineales bacterium]|nr:hypothetical protein [Anaerolineales bacterium]HRE48279.1 hypothetical protein [Aggregatilineales bacterium]
MADQHQKTPATPTAALGLAGAMGCFMALFALGSLAFGLAIDPLLGGRKLGVVAAILLGLPLNLGLAMWLTRLLISRILPQGKGSGVGGDESANEP